MIDVIEKRFPSSDEKHELYARIYLPEGDVKGLFHVVHGMIEHIGRYDGFMRTMAENGWICYGYDNLGHGKTAADSSELGYMGGYRYARCTFTNKLWDKLIIMGTAGPNHASYFGTSLLDRLIATKGKRYISKTIEKMMFGTYNNHFDEEDAHAWLSSIKETRDLYHADRYCAFHFCVDSMNDLLQMLQICNRKAWFCREELNVPIFLLSGSEDPVGNYGKGVKKVYNTLKANGKNVRMKLYDGCRHEILNDSKKDEVIKDILDFIRAA